MAVIVGKTQSQIIAASWCLLGGGTRVGTVLADSVISQSSRSHWGRHAGSSHVLVDGGCVDRYRRSGAFAGGGDDRRARIRCVAGYPNPGGAGSSGRVRTDEAALVDLETERVDEPADVRAT